jgi:outer membrane protein assembly factor BamB/predicted phosphodiesterase
MKKQIVLLVGLLLSAAVYGAEPLRFAWFTDTHVGARTGIEDLRDCVADVNAQSGFDFVIVSGDLTELDVEGWLPLAKQILDSLTLPYYAIPGNHDTKWSSSGGTLFRRLWGDDRFYFEKKGIAFVGFDQGPLMKMADGFVTPQNLTWLENMVEKTAAKKLPLMIITHYPLDHSVENAYNVLSVLHRADSKAIFHGHGHANRFRWYGGIPGLMSRSTMRPPQTPRPHFHSEKDGSAIAYSEKKPQVSSSGYNIVTLWPDSLIEVQERHNFAQTFAPWIALEWNTASLKPDSLFSLKKDFSVNTQYSQVNQLWEYESGAAITTSPVIYGKLTYVSSSGGDLLAIEQESGKLKWQTRIGAPIFSEPAIYKGTLVVGCTDSLIYGIKASNGKILWKVKDNAAVVSSPVISKGVAYIGGSGGNVYALDVKSGEILWKFSGVKGYIETKPLIYKEKLIFGAWDNTLYALNLSDGSLAWSWSEGPKGILYSPAAVQPVGAYGKVFIVAPDRVLSAIDAETGETLYRKEGMVLRESIGLGNRSTTVFGRAMRDTIWAVSATASEYKVQWKSGLGYGFDINPSPLIEEDGILYIPAQDGLLYALDSKSGEHLWTHRVGLGLVNTPAIKKNKIYVTTIDGLVKCLILETN